MKQLARDLAGMDVMAFWSRAFVDYRDSPDILPT
jgi:hypothetical protein